jgi:hypothetical protein
VALAAAARSAFVSGLRLIVTDLQSLPTVIVILFAPILSGTTALSAP